MPKGKDASCFILFRTGEILLIFFIKFGGLIPESTQDTSSHNCSCISNETCVIPLPETFYFNDVLKN